MQKVEGSNPFSRFDDQGYLPTPMASGRPDEALGGDERLVEQFAEEPSAGLVAGGTARFSFIGRPAEVGALGADQLLQLAAVEEDAVAGGALVDRDAISRVGAHRALALGADQLFGLVSH
jgi:hypothetical protein